MSSNKQRAPRNKTITVTPHEQLRYKDRLLYHNDETSFSIQQLCNKIVLGNSLDVVKAIPSESFELIILDPPYNLNKDFHGYQFKATDDNGYENYLESWFGEIIRTLKPNGSLYLCGDWKNSAILYQVMYKYLTILNRISWQREKGRGAKMNWKNAMEDIYFGVKDKKNYYFNVEAVKMKRKVIAPYRQNGKPKDWEETAEGNFRLTYPSNFWDDISIPYWSMPENTDHPTQKPEKLIAKLILASSKEGDLIFDPFLGSGTTAVVAKKLGRNFVGIEFNEEYAFWAEKRLELAEQNPVIQGYTDGVFWERNSGAIQQKLKKSKITIQSKLL